MVYLNPWPTFNSTRGRRRGGPRAEGKTLAFFTSCVIKFDCRLRMHKSRTLSPTLSFSLSLSHSFPVLKTVTLKPIYAHTHIHSIYDAWGSRIYTYIYRQAFIYRIYTRFALDNRINCRNASKKFTFSLAIKTEIKQLKKQYKEKEREGERERERERNSCLCSDLWHLLWVKIKTKMAKNYLKFDVAKLL